jgi:hypothetical protein
MRGVEGYVFVCMHGCGSLRFSFFFFPPFPGGWFSLGWLAGSMAFIRYDGACVAWLGVADVMYLIPKDNLRRGGFWRFVVLLCGTIYYIGLLVSLLCCCWVVGSGSGSTWDSLSLFGIVLWEEQVAAVLLGLLYT